MAINFKLEDNSGSRSMAYCKVILASSTQSISN